MSRNEPKTRQGNPIANYQEHSEAPESGSTEPEKPVYKIGRDGQKVNPKTVSQALKNIQPHQWQPGQSGNPNGRPVSPVNQFKRELTELLQQPYWKDKDKSEQKTLVNAILQKAVDKYFETNSDGTFLRLLELFNSIDSDLLNKQQSNSSPAIQNVLILPAQNPPINARPLPAPDDSE